MIMSSRVSQGYLRYRLFDRREVLAHRYIMAQHTGRELLTTEHVHHKDENKLNNDISNLELLNSGAHAALHHSQNPAPQAVLVCAGCNLEFTRPLRYMESKKKLQQLGFYCSRICGYQFRQSRACKALEAYTELCRTDPKHSITEAASRLGISRGAVCHYRRRLKDDPNKANLVTQFKRKFAASEIAHIKSSKLPLRQLGALYNIDHKSIWRIKAAKT